MVVVFPFVPVTPTQSSEVGPSPSLARLKRASAVAVQGTMHWATFRSGAARSTTTAVAPAATAAFK
ncbi:MAG: hypothetical protein Fues2KO_44060 [Fuerstiella sp.]